jgi:hypothetical protein
VAKSKYMSIVGVGASSTTLGGLRGHCRIFALTTPLDSLTFASLRPAEPPDPPLDPASRHSWTARPVPPRRTRESGSGRRPSRDAGGAAFEGTTRFRPKSRENPIDAVAQNALLGERYRCGHSTMALHVALHHRTTDRYDRLITLGPQIDSPAPGAAHADADPRLLAQGFTPPDHFLNWLQDPQSNYLARRPSSAADPPPGRGGST